MKAAELKAAELYEKDFYRWAIHNADLLSAGEVAKADIQHIAEERPAVRREGAAL
jgi:hypothetical protein